MWVSLMQTLVWLVPNILSNRGAERRPLQTTSGREPSLLEQPLVMNGVGADRGLAAFLSCDVPDTCVLHFRWPLSKAEEGRSCPHLCSSLGDTDVASHHVYVGLRGLRNLLRSVLAPF